MCSMTRKEVLLWGAALAAAVTFCLVGIFQEARAVESAGAVTYYRAENVAKSFSQGAVLFDQDRNYMIHTSRRVAAGKAEIHTRDTDLIYVLEGSARFVTGGQVVGGTSSAPDEIRGESIEGGETRILSKGDVIIVPAGTPHWFQDVRGPVLYYTIKVRQEEK